MEPAKITLQFETTFASGRRGFDIELAALDPLANTNGAIGAIDRK